MNCLYLFYTFQFTINTLVYLFQDKRFQKLLRIDWTNQSAAYLAFWFWSESLIILRPDSKSIFYIGCIVFVKWNWKFVDWRCKQFAFHFTAAWITKFGFIVGCIIVCCIWKQAIFYLVLEIGSIIIEFWNRVPLNLKFSGSKPNRSDIFRWPGGNVRFSFYFWTFYG